MSLLACCFSPSTLLDKIIPQGHFFSNSRLLNLFSKYTIDENALIPIYLEDFKIMHSKDKIRHSDYKKKKVASVFTLNNKASQKILI